MNIIPLSYSIPDEYIVKTVPDKTRLFSEVIPGGRSNYLYKAGEEDKYIEQYRSSRFAYTSKKGGWDCLRHYEILAAGCIPVFTDLDECPSNTMTSFPKALIKEACAALLPWEDSKEELYKSYVIKLLDHCRNHCSTSASAGRFLSFFHKVKKVLLIQCNPGENYTRELLSIGLRRTLGSDYVDYPKIDVLYKDCELGSKYGNGFTYGGKLDNIDIDRSNIESRIKSHEFDLIIFGKVGRDEGGEGYIPHMPLWQTVSSVYGRDEIVFLYGGDGCQTLTNLNSPYTSHLMQHATRATCFVRELN